MTDINSIVNREMIKAITAIFESKMSSDSDEEKRRQERMAKAVDARGIVADGDKNVKEQDEADEETDDKEETEKREDRTGGKGTADSKKVNVPKDAVLKAPTLGSVIDKLNALRGGRSLKDKDVKESFEQYFEGLSKSERQSLLAFLTGIAQILSGVEKGAEALEPKDVGVTTKSPKEKSVQEPKDQKGTEESPIVVGEKKNYDIKKALTAYRNNDV